MSLRWVRTISVRILHQKSALTPAVIALLLADHTWAAADPAFCKISLMEQPTLGSLVEESSKSLEDALQAAWTH